MKKLLSVMTLIALCTGFLIQPSFADESDLQRRIQETMSKYLQVKEDSSFVDDSDMSGFDTKEAIKKVSELGSDVTSVISQIEEVQSQKKDTDERYVAMLNQVKKVIIDINETKKTVSDAVMKMNVYNKDIAQTLRSLQQTREYIVASKESLRELVETLYLVHNDFYAAGGQDIDDMKLLLKSENIGSTLSADDIMNSLIEQFDTLVGDLTDHQEEYSAQYTTLTKIRGEYKKVVIGYEEKIVTLEEQKAYLMDFLKLYKANKVVLDAEMNELFQTRKQLKNKIALLVRSVRDYDQSQSFLNSENYAKFLALKDDREMRKNFFLWPVLPVTDIATYFSLSGTESEDGFAGVKLPAKQYDEIYAPANGIVYKAVDQDGIAINRLVLVHNGGYTTVFTNINKSLVKEGDIVRRGQIIGLVGGQPGTRGAGFQGKGEGLYFQIYQQGVPLDPLEHLDLSIFSAKSILQEKYRPKYTADTQLRNSVIHISDVPRMPGKTDEEKRTTFLKRFGAAPYDDVLLWEAAARDTNIDVDLGICIGLAETSLGRYFASSNNIGNVGNNDRGDRVDKVSPLAGIQSIYQTLNNSYLGGYHTIFELSGYGNKDGAIYASSPYNWQKNVSRCLSSIKGYVVPEDYPFRTYKENK